jgi:hypothetical protein
MKNVSDKTCGKSKNTHCMFNELFPEIHGVCEIMWKNTVERGRPQITLRCMPLHAGYMRLKLHTL